MTEAVLKVLIYAPAALAGRDDRYRVFNREHGT